MLVRALTIARNVGSHTTLGCIWSLLRQDTRKKAKRTTLESTVIDNKTLKAIRSILEQIAMDIHHRNLIKKTRCFIPVPRVIVNLHHNFIMKATGITLDKIITDNLDPND